MRSPVAFLGLIVMAAAVAPVLARACRDVVYIGPYTEKTASKVHLRVSIQRQLGRVDATRLVAETPGPTS